MLSESNERKRTDFIGAFVFLFTLKTYENRENSILIFIVK
jgi:hypothetical protein